MVRLVLATEDLQSIIDALIEGKNAHPPSQDGQCRQAAPGALEKIKAPRRFNRRQGAFYAQGVHPATVRALIRETDYGKSGAEMPITPHFYV